VEYVVRGVGGGGGGFDEGGGRVSVWNILPFK